MTSDRYPEKNKVQVTAIAWLEAAGRYQEVFHDQEATGDRMDSAGFLDGRLTAIECKSELCGGETIFRPESYDSTIEAKISGTLRDLYTAGGGRLTVALQAAGFGPIPLQIIILSGNFTGTARLELEEMLRSRSVDWCFEYRICRWTSTVVEELAHGGVSSWPSASGFADLAVPEQVPKSRPRARLGWDGLRKEASEAGTLDPFDGIASAAKKLGFKTTPSGSTLLIRNAGGTPFATAYSKDADRKSGIRIGIDFPKKGALSAELPGQAVPGNGKGLGYRDVTRAIVSVDEFKCLLQLYRVWS